MEGLQIAQILADLSDLQNTEPSAATALLSAHRTPVTQPRSTSISSLSSPTSPSASLSQSITSANSNSKHDRLGRRIIRPTPSLPRAESNPSSLSMTSSSLQDETDEDLRRARTLLELFEQRGRFKQMGDTGLLRSKERVDVVAARYAERDLEEKEKALRVKRGVANA